MNSRRISGDFLSVTLGNAEWIGRRPFQESYTLVGSITQQLVYVIHTLSRLCHA